MRGKVLEMLTRSQDELNVSFRTLAEKLNKLDARAVRPFVMLSYPYKSSSNSFAETSRHLPQ